MSRATPTDEQSPDDDRLRRVMAELATADHELTSPPPEVWASIEAVVEPDGTIDDAALATDPRTPPLRLADGLVVDYWIDADDHLVDVGGAWESFARDNLAPELVDRQRGVSLWSQMDSAEIRELWQMLVRRARTHGQPVDVTFRCDGPHARRWFEMTVSPEANGLIHFRCLLVFEETRPIVPLLDPLTDRDTQASAIEVCSWCGRGELDSEWLDIEQLVTRARLLERDTLPPISNGICGECRDEMAAEFADLGVTDD